MDSAGRIRRCLANLPKAELHLHAEGSMRRETANEFADRYGLQPIEPPDEYTSWSSFSMLYERCRELVGSLDDLRRIVEEVLLDSAATGTVWCELHLVPHLYGGRLGPVDGIVEAALDGANSAWRSGDASGGLILGVDRNLGRDEAQEVARLAIKHRDRGIVAMGLTGDETHSTFTNFVDAFDLVRRAGLGVIPHSGEQGPPSNVRETVGLLRPHRISHGVAAAHDPTIIDMLRERDICLDVAVTSNVKLKSVPSLSEHPVVRLVDAGVPISLNSDITLLASCSIVDEYDLVFRMPGMSVSKIAGIAANSLRFARSHEDLLALYASRISDWVRNLDA